MHALFNRKHYQTMSYHYKMVVFIKMWFFYEAFDFGRLNDGVTIAQNTCGSHLVALAILIYDDSNPSV